jgi:hypothetical protein
VRQYAAVSLLALAFLVAVRPLVAQEPGIEFFEKKVRPILVEHCYECHANGAKKIRGKLWLDSRDGLRKGGESGPALVPGHPEKSLLIKAVRFDEDDLKMPPRGKLPAAVIADLEAWIKMGAPDPRGKASTAKAAPSWDELVATRKQWWSLQTVRKPPIPQPKDAAYSNHAIDRFLLATMEAKGLTPAPPASPQTLLRRLSLVLTGLPPTAKEIADFEESIAARKIDAAVGELVDRLLSSPHFGERWARHWMDVVRFSETHGNEWNYEVHHAWRYRDYLIRAFNIDVPFDQLIREHIAGDLLPAPRWNKEEQFNESLIGTAFYRFGEVNHDDCISLRQIGYDVADNQIDTLTKAFQGMTVACARCHDHKLDAVSMRDYYGLLGVLNSSRCVSHTIDAPEVNAELRQQMHGKKLALRQELAELWLQQAEPDRVEKWLNGLALGKYTLDDPLGPWQQLAAWQQKDKLGFADAYARLVDQLTRADAENTKLAAGDIVTLADFRKGAWPPWQVGGQGLRDKPSRPGEFAVAAIGERAIQGLLPAGCYTHLVSSKLNGTLRSPVLTIEATARKKWISFRVMGQSSSAVRLVSNNCQLNYKNYRALTSDQWQWVTFELPEDRDSLNVYAELMTKFDNPKFPDPLGTLGGATKNDRMSWEQAASDPTSYFGVTHVVLHDQRPLPQPGAGAVREFFSAPAPKTAAELARRFAERLESALRAWKMDQASDDDVRWLNAFLERGYLTNKAEHPPRLAQLVAEYRVLDAKLALPRIVPGLADSGRAFEQPVFTRGDCSKPGATVPRGFVAILTPKPFSTNGSGRLELAQRMASPDNPLTARVLVNRLWHHLFGAGLVRTVDDFGHIGEKPSHPELLDYLAERFMAEGWSVKRLIRAIVLTRTFQASHTPSAASLAVDPENRLLQHYPARRMEAETIRDALLATSGRLDRILYGRSIAAFRDKDNEDRRLYRGPLDGLGRRSIYIRVTLMEAPAFLEAFNLPGGKVSQGRRDVTNVPAQALAMLNDPFVLQQAGVWSKALIARKSDTIGRRLDAMFRAALGRNPRLEEHERFTRFVVQLAALHNTAPETVLGSEMVWGEVAHTMFNLQEFIFIP